MMSALKSAGDLFNEALVVLDSGEFEKGRLSLEETIACAREQGDVSTLVSALVCMADLLVQLDDFDAADELLCEIFSHEKTLKGKSQSGQGTQDAQDAQDVDEMLMQDIQNAHFIEDMLLCRRVYNKALDFLETEQLEEGEYAMRRAISLSQEKNCYDVLLSSLVCMADMLIQLGRNREARDFLEQALRYEQTGEAVAAIPPYKDVFADNFERARELLSLL